MDDKFNPALIIAIAVVAVSALMYVFWLNSGSIDSGTLPFGKYVLANAVTGSESLDNLAQMEECMNRSDRSCETAMLSDGRTFLVEKGTLLDGSEIGYGVFEGRIQSGAREGKLVYLPVAVIKSAR